jgi:hypothetical protein
MLGADGSVSTAHPVNPVPLSRPRPPDAMTGHSLLITPQPGDAGDPGGRAIGARRRLVSG